MWVVKCVMVWVSLSEFLLVWIILERVFVTAQVFYIARWGETVGCGRCMFELMCVFESVLVWRGCVVKCLSAGGSGVCYAWFVKA